ncbi:MAG: hypothetical protein AAFU67_14920, partial [Bacteroidota bacterium]
ELGSTILSTEQLINLRDSPVKLFGTNGQCFSIELNRQPFLSSTNFDFRLPPFISPGLYGLSWGALTTKIIIR